MSKILKTYEITPTGQVIINYIDNLGVDQIINKPLSEVFSIDLNEEVEQYIADDNNIPLSKDRVKFIKIENGYFTVVGDKLPPKLQSIADLSEVDAEIFTAFAEFVNSYTNSPLVSLSSQLNTGSVTINGVTYNSTSTPTYAQFATAANGSLLAATLMAIRLYNEQ